MPDHPFAQYVRILGRGRHGSRAMSGAEAQAAMQAILAGEVEPEQLGAFLMLMRVKEESPEELAGFVRAARADIAAAHTDIGDVAVDLDWSSYAGKRRQLPWFLLSVLLLARHGVRVFMHGLEGRRDERVYTPAALAALGITPCASLAEAAQRLAADHFAYLPLGAFSPRLQHMIELRSLLGLRSPIHTVARLLNPFAAPHVMQGIFHPGYKAVHQQAALILNQPHATVIKGEGGEIERNPDVPCLAFTVHHGVLGEEEWPAMFGGRRHIKDETMDVQRLAALWSGEIEDEYGAATVIATAAVALKLLGRAADIVEAEEMARTLWMERC